MVPAYQADSELQCPPKPANGASFAPAGLIFVDPATGDEYESNGYGYFEGRFNGQFVREFPGHTLVERVEEMSLNDIREQFKEAGIDEEYLVRLLKHYGVQVDYAIWKDEKGLAQFSLSEDVMDKLLADLYTPFGAKEINFLMREARKLWAEFSSDWVITRLESLKVVCKYECIPDADKLPYSKWICVDVENYSRAHDLCIRLDVDIIAASGALLDGKRASKALTPKTEEEYENKYKVKEITTDEMAEGQERYHHLQKKAAELKLEEKLSEILSQLSIDPELGEEDQPMLTPARMKAVEKLFNFFVETVNVKKENVETQATEVEEFELDEEGKKLLGIKEEQNDQSPTRNIDNVNQHAHSDGAISGAKTEPVDPPGFEPPGDDAEDVLDVLSLHEAPLPEQKKGEKFAIEDDESLNWFVKKVNAIEAEIESLKQQKKDQSSHFDAMIAERERKLKGLRWRFGAETIAYVKRNLPVHSSDSKPGAKDPHKAGDYKSTTYKVPAGKISLKQTGGPTCVNSKQWQLWIDSLTDEELPLYGVETKTVRVQPKAVAEKLVEEGVAQIDGWVNYRRIEHGDFTIGYSTTRKKAEDQNSEGDAA